MKKSEAEMKNQGEQIAALPLRWDDAGRMQILMITSRETGRWVVPKGWLMDGKKPWQAAEIEALEEAGAEGPILHDKIGEFRYGKVLDDGSVLPCRVQVYPMVVRKLRREWKEKHERKRRWFPAKEAARLVDEPDLARLIRRVASESKAPPAVAELRAAS